MQEEQRFATTLTLILILSSALLSLWLSFTAGFGVWISYTGLTFNVVFAFLLWRGKPWAKLWLLGRYAATLVYAILLCVLKDYVGAIFEALVSVSAMLLLVGLPTMRRAYVALTLYVMVLTALGALLVSFAQEKRERSKIVAVAHNISQYKSPHQYKVAMGKMPWRQLSGNQAEQLLGMENDAADLSLVRSDGSSYALFFPLQFSNIPLNERLLSLLENKIQDGWLSNLKDWKRLDRPDGFILTAQGKVKGLPITYAVLYKHFGNMGVYAVFWTDRRHHRRLVSEVGDFYNNISAPPIKERLPRFTPSQIYEKNHEAVVLINVYDKDHKLVGKGTGFNIAPDGMIITNLHVVLAGRYLEVVFPNKKPIKEVEIAGLTPPKYDLALLSVKGKDLPTLRAFKSVPVVPGDTVYVLGNPKGLVNSLSQGIVGAVRDGGELTLYQITAPISPGSSGGPVFSEYGEIIGVANSVVVDAQNLNFSISVDEMKNLYLFKDPLTLDALIDKLDKK